jgi:DNA-binding transcriptional LysR family regulator
MQQVVLREEQKLHITIRQLQVFTSVARHLSYTRSAEELHLTQPAVSMQVKQLEGQVGLPLFEQIGKKIYRTEAADIMLSHAQKILQHLVLAKREMDGLKGVDSGRLRVAVASTVNYFAARLLAAFSRQYPNVEIGLDVTNRETLLQKLEANEPDLVLMGQPPSGLDVEASVFMDNPLIMIAAPDHPLAQSQEITLDLLAKETFVVREFGSGTRLAMERFFAEDGFVPRSTVEMTGNEVIKQGVEVGLGLSIISVHTAELELSAGRLVSLDVLRMPIVRRWYVAHRKGKRLSPTALLFKQYVLEEGLRQSKE